MKKPLLALFLITSLSLTGCKSSPTGNESEKPQSSMTYMNKETTPFSLTLPAEFNAQSHKLLPTKEGAFPPVYFSFSKETADTPVVSYAQKEKDFQAEQCKGKPEQCASVMDEQAVMINHYDALNYTVQYKSVNPEKEGEHMNNYHTSFKRGEDFVHFWTYAGDKEKPEEAKKQFDEIIKTISFDVQASKPKKEPNASLEESEGEELSFENIGTNYTISEKEISISKDNLNLAILYGRTNEYVDEKAILENEQTWSANLCSQTDRCPEFINHAYITLKNGYKSLKYTRSFKGRSLDTEEGFINEFHYSIISPEGNLYRFWTSATDQENPKEKAALFNSFMETISFNKTT